MSKAVMTGGCQCGAVRYALYAEPVGISLCHCRMCQKAVGGPFAALAPVRAEAFAWTRGKPATFRSSSAAERDFCAACGTPLSFRYLHENRIALTVGSLDDPEAAVPTKAYAVESEVSWLRHVVTGDLPGHPAVSGDGPAYIRTLVNYQHPDHETQDGWVAPRG
jgi:hypothetical protein